MTADATPDETVSEIMGLVSQLCAATSFCREYGDEPGGNAALDNALTDCTDALTALVEERDDLRNDLTDFHMIIRHCSEIYDEVSGGRISKPNTLPSEVISVMEELRQEEIAEAVKEATEEMVEERDRYREDVAVLLRDRMGLSKLVVRLEADAERLAGALWDVREAANRAVGALAAHDALQVSGSGRILAPDEGRPTSDGAAEKGEGA